MYRRRYVPVLKRVGTKEYVHQLVVPMKHRPLILKLAHESLVPPTWALTR